RGCTRSGHPVHRSLPPFVRAGAARTETHLASSGPSTVSALRDGRLVERRANALGELHRVVVRPEVHEEHPRLLVEHVAMDRRDPNAVGEQGTDRRIALLAGGDETAGDRRLAAAGGLEVDGVRRSHGAGHRHSAIGDRVLARYTELIDPAVDLALRSHDLI